MKKHLLFIAILVILSSSHGFSQTSGFIQSECGLIENPNYWFENYEVGNHGYGYKLYHNGTIIRQEEAFYDGYVALDLRFTDSTHGFFISQEMTWTTVIHRIVNNSLEQVGAIGGFGDGYFYVVNSETGYFAQPGVAMYRIATYEYQKEVGPMNTIHSDTTVYDTIKGSPLCAGMDQLDYLMWGTPDSAIYTILFTSGNVSTDTRSDEPDISIYPNPAIDQVRIQSGENRIPTSIQILDELGRTRKTINPDQWNETEIFIGDLNSGFYFVVVDFSGTKYIRKLLKL